VPLILMLAAAAPLNSLSTVSGAQLQHDLRFRELAWIGLLTTTVITILSVWLAKLGFGAASFVLPQPVGALLRAGILFVKAKSPIRWRLDLRRWRFLIGDSGYMLAAAALGTAVSQGDYLTLGLLRSKTELGNYYFAFNLSTQTIQLVAFNIGNALFPALSRLQLDSERQLRGFFHAARLVAIVAIPACLLQAAIAHPLFRVLFPKGWSAAIPVFQALSLGMTFQVLSGPAISLFQARGRFAAYFWWSLLCGVSFFAFVISGAFFGAAFSVSVAVGIFYAIFGPLGAYASASDSGATWRQIAALYTFPTIAGSAAIFPIAYLILHAPVAAAHPAAQILLMTCGALILYALFLRLAAPRDYDLLTSLLQRVFNTIARR